MNNSFSGRTWEILWTIWNNHSIRKTSTKWICVWKAQFDHGSVRGDIDGFSHCPIGNKICLNRIFGTQNYLCSLDEKFNQLCWESDWESDYCDEKCPCPCCAEDFYHLCIDWTQLTSTNQSIWFIGSLSLSIYMRQYIVF